MIIKCIMNMERIFYEMNLSQWMCHTFTVVGVVHSSYLCSVHNQQGRARSCTCHLTSIVCMPSIIDFFVHYAKLMSTNGFPISTFFIPVIMPLAVWIGLLRRSCPMLDIYAARISHSY